MWQELPPPLLARANISTASGLPGTGANLTIPAAWNVQLDTETAVLWHLELQGALTFSEAQATTLNVHSLAMPLGSLSAGNASHPHPTPVRPCQHVAVHNGGEYVLLRHASIGARCSDGYKVRLARICVG